MHFIELIPIISFIVFLLLIAGKVLLLRKQKVNIAAKQNSGGIKQILYKLMFTVIFLLWFLEIIRPAVQIDFTLLPYFMTKEILSSGIIFLTGLFAVFGAIVLLLFTLIHFRKSIRFGLDPANLGELITTGIFSISRNPFFVSVELYLLGVSLLIPSFFMIGFTCLAILAIHFFILKEEKFMLGNYGEDYQKYVRKVRRYF